MDNINDSTLQQLDALNNWLANVYGTDTSLSSLLADADTYTQNLPKLVGGC